MSCCRGLSGYDICKQLRPKKVSTAHPDAQARDRKSTRWWGSIWRGRLCYEPFGVRELLARIHARSCAGRTGTAVAAEQTEAFR